VSIIIPIGNYRLVFGCSRFASILAFAFSQNKNASATTATIMPVKTIMSPTSRHPSMQHTIFVNMKRPPAIPDDLSPNGSAVSTDDPAQIAWDDPAFPAN
jgi:hypothetical protein